MTSENKNVYVFVQLAGGWDVRTEERISDIFNTVLKTNPCQKQYQDVLEKTTSYRTEVSELQGEEISTLPVLVAEFNTPRDALSFLSGISMGLLEANIRKIETGILHNKPS